MTNPIDLALAATYDVIKIVAIPLIGFFLYQFYKGVVALKKAVERLIVQMQCRETYCFEKHKEIGEHLCRHDKEIEDTRTDLVSQGKKISKIEGQLSKS
jgi:hypothetical protein